MNLSGESGGVPAAGAGRSGVALLIAFPAIKLLIHLVVALRSGYEYHRDEMYYLVCATRLDWGYVDHPPFSVFTLAVTRRLIGDSVAAIRTVPAIAGALTVLFIGLMTRRLGGRSIALILAMTAAITAPFYLALDGYFSLNALDLLIWSVAAWLLIRILQGGSPRLWLVLGVVLGVGLENKISVLWLGAGIFGGLILSPQRESLKTRWPWLAGVIAFALFLPHVLWQVFHGVPTLEFMANATENKLVWQSVPVLWQGQLEGMLKASGFIWLSGLVFYLFMTKGRPFRVLGWAWLIVFAILASTHTVRGAYLAPAYTWLLAAGGVAIEQWLAGRRVWVRVGCVAVLLDLIGRQFVAAAPFVLPILPQDRLAAAFAPQGRQIGEEKTGVGALPEFMGHMSGWNDLVSEIDDVFVHLPIAEKERAVVILPDYGMAAAIDILGRPRGLPPALSGHNTYWLWGRANRTLDVAIVVGPSEDTLRRSFADVTYAARTSCEYCMPYENARPIWIVRGPLLPVDQIWSRFKLYE